MGILDKIKGKRSKKTTKNFYFGHTEAEGENVDGLQNFSHYFEDHLEVLPEIKKKKFIFTGRKGVGKSAIAKFINDQSEQHDESYSDLIKYNDVAIEKVIHNIQSEDKDDLRPVLFEWLIQVRLIRLIVESESAIYTREFKKLKTFLSRNSGMVEIDKYQIDEIISQNGFELKIEVLRQAFPAIFKKHFDKKSHRAHFSKLIIPLREIIQKVLSFQTSSRFEYWILFDDLDVDFKVDREEDIKSLTELIRIAKYYNTKILRKINAYVLIFLRNDIKHIIEKNSADTAKIFSSYEIPINWFSENDLRESEELINIKKLSNKRITQNFLSNEIKFDPTKPWESLFKESPRSYNGKSSFKYILDFTFYRPRDFILLLNHMGTREWTFPLVENQVIALLNNYFKSNVGELRNELYLFFSQEDIEKIFSILSKIAYSYKSNLDYKSLMKYLDEVESRSSEELLEILYSYSIIVPISNGRYCYNYRENKGIDIQLNDEFEYTLHKAIYHYFIPIR